MTSDRHRSTELGIAFPGCVHHPLFAAELLGGPASQPSARRSTRRVPGF